MTKFKNQGFTLIEILVVIGIIAVLAVIVLIAINPARQFAQARNTQRISNVIAVLNAIGQNIADNKGVFSGGCALDSTPRRIKAPAGAGETDLRPCIVPTYMSEVAFDPNRSGAHFTTGTDYDTGYEVFTSTSTSRITVRAPGAELGQTIEITR